MMHNNLVLPFKTSKIYQFFNPTVAAENSKKPKFETS